MSLQPSRAGSVDADPVPLQPSTSACTACGQHVPIGDGFIVRTVGQPPARFHNRGRCRQIGMQHGTTTRARVCVCGHDEGRHRRVVNGRGETTVGVCLARSGDRPEDGCGCRAFREREDAAA